MGGDGGLVSADGKKGKGPRASARITVRRSKDSKVLPARRDQHNRKINKFPIEFMPGYDLTYKKVLVNEDDIMPSAFARYATEFFVAYWQLLHAISFLPAQDTLEDGVLDGVFTFFMNLGLPQHYFPDCATNACSRHYRTALESIGGEKALQEMVWNKQDRFALARWFNDFHNSVHARRRDDKVHTSIVPRQDVPFQQTASYYMMNSGPPFHNTMVESWLYTQFNLNVRKDMCRITSPKLMPDIYKSMGHKIYLLYKKLDPYDEFNYYWRRPTYVTDGYMCRTTQFPFAVVHAISIYSIVHTIVFRLLTTHSYVLERKVTDETMLVFMAMVLSMMIIGQIGEPVY